jgi:hypothetical protein
LTDDEIRDYLETLQDKIGDIKIALQDADEENRSLRQQLADAKRMADFGKEFHFEQGVYWRERYPYCPACWDVERKPVRLAGPLQNPTNMATQIWACSEHKQFILRGLSG